MLYYAATFSIALLFSALAECKIRQRRDSAAKVFLFLSALVLCALAGIRDNSVGTDIAYYADYRFELACRHSSLIEYVNAANIEVGYAIFAFLISRFTSNLGWLLFFSQAMVIIPLYMAAYLKRDHASVFMLSVVYVFWFYCYTLNIMRQSIAGAWLVLFYVLWDLKGRKKALLSLAVALVFHNSAILGLIMLLTAKQVCGKAGSWSLFKRCVLIIGITGVMLGFSRFIEILSAVNLLSGDYARRILAVESGTVITPIELILRAIIMFFPVLFELIVFQKPLNKKREQPSSRNQRLYQYMLLLGFTMSLGVGISPYIDRFVYYCNYYVPISIATYAKSGLKKQSNRRIFCVIELLVVIAYWYIVYMFYRWHAVMPFKTRLS